jgi:hypothetical protein
MAKPTIVKLEMVKLTMNKIYMVTMSKIIWIN